MYKPNPVEAKFLITRRGAFAILRELEQRGWLNHNGVKASWLGLKEQLDPILLPTGAKMFRTRSGDIGIYGYAHDYADIAPYREYQLQEVVS